MEKETKHKKVTAEKIEELLDAVSVRTGRYLGTVSVPVKYSVEQKKQIALGSLRIKEQDFVLVQYPYYER